MYNFLYFSSKGNGPLCVDSVATLIKSGVPLKLFLQLIYQQGNLDMTLIKELSRKVIIEAAVS